MQGATRLLDMSDLQRFRDLPIVVAFNSEVKGKMQTVSHVMELEQLDEDNEEATWRLANMKGNFGARTAQHKELTQSLPICNCTMYSVHADISKCPSGQRQEPAAPQRAQRVRLCHVIALSFEQN